MYFIFEYAVFLNTYTVTTLSIILITIGELYLMYPYKKTNNKVPNVHGIAIVINLITIITMYFDYHNIKSHCEYNELLISIFFHYMYFWMYKIMTAVLILATIFSLVIWCGIIGGVLTGLLYLFEATYIKFVHIYEYIYDLEVSSKSKIE